MGAPGAEAAAWLNGGDYIPEAARGAAPFACSGKSGDFIFNGGHLYGNILRIELFAAETALDGFQVDDLSTGGALFSESNRGAGEVRGEGGGAAARLSALPQILQRLG
jgi:hypothetical protein